MYTTKKRDIQKAFFCILLLLSILTLPGCDSVVSVDKDDSYILLDSTEFEYHEETNVTTVYCTVVLQNDTIYNIRSFEVNFQTFCNGERLDTDPCTYEYKIKHGKTQSTVLTFTQEGKVDRVGIASWEPVHEPFWKTYLTPIVIVGVIVIGGIAFWLYDEFF